MAEDSSPDPGGDASEAPDSSQQSVAQILQEFERTRERRPNSEEAAEQVRQEHWLAQFEEHRERIFRVGFEEIAWQLEQRGHHAWIVDVLGGGTEEANGLELKMLPIADMRTASHAPGLQIVPDASRSRVIAQVHDIEPGEESVRVVAVAELDRVDADAVARLGAHFIDVVLLRTERVLEPVEPAAPGDWAPEHGGIKPTRGQSADWLG